MGKQYQLRGHSGPVTGQIIKLDEREITLGRDLATDIVIPDSEVSRLHARMSWQGERHVVRDQKSTNGTWVNGRAAVAGIALSVGDLLTLGKTSVFVYEPVPESELDTTREGPDAGDLLTSTLAMPVPADAGQEARRATQARPPRPALPAEQAAPAPVTSPGRTLHQKYLAHLAAGDLEALVNLYHANATLFTAERSRTGATAIREFYRQLLAGERGAAIRAARATGAYVEGPDAIVCETALETAESVMRVQDMFVFCEQKITHHFRRTDGP